MGGWSVVESTLLNGLPPRSSRPYAQHPGSREEPLEWLLSGFGVVSIGLPDQARDEGSEQSLAPAAGVVDELEEAEIERQLLLRDTPVRSEPGAQQGP